MASLTLTSHDSSHDEPDFESDIAGVGNDIEAYFSRLIDTITIRRNQLLAELDSMLALHLEEKRNREARRQELGEMLRYHEDKSRSSSLKELQDNVLNQIRNELAAIPSNLKKNIRFECDESHVRTASELGTLHFTEGSVPPFQSNMEYEPSTEDISIEPRLNSSYLPAPEESRPFAFNPEFVDRVSSDAPAREDRERTLFPPLYK